MTFRTSDILRKTASLALYIDGWGFEQEMGTTCCILAGDFIA